MNWGLDARGQDVLSGLPLLWGPGDGPANDAYFQTLSISNLEYVKTMIFALLLTFIGKLKYKAIMGII